MIDGIHDAHMISTLSLISCCKVIRCFLTTEGVVVVLAERSADLSDKIETGRTHKSRGLLWVHFRVIDPGGRVGVFTVGARTHVQYLQGTVNTTQSALSVIVKPFRQKIDDGLAMGQCWFTMAYNLCHVGAMVLDPLSQMTWK